MFPAARKGDPITHDLLVPCGVIAPPVSGPCPQGPVMIEFLPAAHALCTVVCTGVISGGIAHPPPPPTPPVPIPKGSATVLIHGQQAARWSPAPDTGGCGVFLGDPKLAASRTVLIGDSAGAGGGAGGGGGGPGEEGAGDAEDVEALTDALYGEPADYSQEPPANPPPGPSTQEVDTGTHWLEIEMVDEAEQPVVGELYIVRLPDGKERRGGLDARGQVRFTGIKNPGACQIRFPNLDLAAWERWRPGPSTPPSASSSTPPPGAATGVETSPVAGGPPTRGGQWRQVRQGECMNSIAKDTGHFWQTLWDHAANAELKRRRGNPNILMPGDAVFVPHKRPKEESGNTDAHHKFRRKGEPATLRLRVMDEDEPLGNTPYRLEVDGQVFEGATDGDGYAQCPIPGNARRGTLFVGEPGEQEEYPLLLGTVDPIDTRTGVIERLQNLGYDIEPGTSDETARLADVLEAFQEQHGLPPTGELDAATRAKLLEVHGS